MNLDPYLILYQEIELKSMINLSVHNKTIKLLEENICTNLSDLVLGNDLLDMILNALND